MSEVFLPLDDEQTEDTVTTTGANNAHVELTHETVEHKTVDDVDAWSVSDELEIYHDQSLGYFGEVMSAGIQKYSTLYSPIKALGRQTLREIADETHPEIDTFDIKKTLEEDEVPKEQYARYANCQDRLDYVDVKETLEAEETLDRDGLIGNTIGAIAAGVLDPLNAFSLGASYAISKTAAVIDGIALGATNTLIRRATQTAMTDEEVATEVIGSVVVGGMLSCCNAAQYWKQTRKVKKLEKAVKQFLDETGVDAKYEFDDQGTLFSLGEKCPENIKRLALLTPYIRAATSGDRTYADIGTALFKNQGIITRAVREGEVASLSVEAGKEFGMNELAKLRKNVEAVYERWFTEGKVSSKAEFVKIQQQELRGLAEETEASQDIRSFFKWTNSLAKKYNLTPALEDASEEVLSKTKDFGKNKGREKKVLTAEEVNLSLEELKAGGLENTSVTAEKYFPRAYNKDVINKNRDEITSLLKKAIAKDSPRLTEKGIEKKANKMLNSMIGGSINNIFQESVSFTGKTGGSMAKPRTVNITDELLEKFMIQDPIEILESICPQLFTGCELNRIAMERGSKNWKNLLTKFSNDRAASIPKNADALKYSEETKTMARELQSYAEVIAGTYSKGDSFATNAMHNIKTFNAMTRLGSVLVTSFNDISNVVAKHGLKRSIKTAAQECFSKNSYVDKQAYETVVQITEREFSSARVFDEVYSDAKQLSKLGRVSKFYSRLSLMPRFNDFWKRVAASLHYEEILIACRHESKEGNLLLRQRGISEETKRVINDKFNQIGYMDGERYVLPLDRLGDEQLSKQLFATVKAAADNTIISVGAGDIPLFMRTGIGSFLMQFKSFSYANFTNITMPMLLQKEARSHLFEYIATTAALSISTTYIKNLISGNNDPTESDTFWERCIDISSIFGPYMDIVSDSVKAGRSFLKGETLKGIGKMSAPIGLVDDLGQAASAIADYIDVGEITEKQERAIGRSIPFRNMLYWYWYLSRLNIGGEL